MLDETRPTWCMLWLLVTHPTERPLAVCTKVSPRTLLAWVRHYFALAAFTLLHKLAGRAAANSRHFRLRRWADAWAWGSGQVDKLQCSLDLLADSL